jgi:hypothetical protein
MIVALNEMTGRDYELLAQAIFQQLHDQDVVPGIVVDHNVIKQGAKTKHQIDVYWEFTLGGVTYRTVVQAKNWADPVDQGEVLKFEAVLRDLPGQPRGIMVTANGYQRGALDVAAACGITIYELKEETPPRLTITYTGWAHFALKGYFKTAGGQKLGLTIETEIVTPEFSGLIFHADPAWIQENGGVATDMTGLRFLPHEVGFCDAEQHVVRTLREIYQELAMEVDRRGETEARQSHSFDAPTFLRLPSGASTVKVTGLSVDVTIRKELQERLWTAPNVVTFILKSLDDENTQRFVHVPEE